MVLVLLRIDDVGRRMANQKSVLYEWNQHAVRAFFVVEKCAQIAFFAELGAREWDRRCPLRKVDFQQEIRARGHDLHRLGRTGGSTHDSLNRTTTGRLMRIPRQMMLGRLEDVQNTDVGPGRAERD